MLVCNCLREGKEGGGGFCFGVASTFGTSPFLPEADEERLEVWEAKVRLVQFFAVEALTEPPVPNHSASQS